MTRPSTLHRRPVLRRRTPCARAEVQGLPTEDRSKPCCQRRAFPWRLLPTLVSSRCLPLHWSLLPKSWLRWSMSCMRHCRQGLREGWARATAASSSTRRNCGRARAIRSRRRPSSSKRSASWHSVATASPSGSTLWASAILPLSICCSLRTSSCAATTTDVARPASRASACSCRRRSRHSMPSCCSRGRGSASPMCAPLWRGRPRRVLMSSAQRSRGPMSTWPQ
mmetsp:Transcript_10362/g.36442  ORF Transcript_10362/g.36442 Transcript_10362/m.36442 type:complete len:224 (+) Transcript_10362:137-808(+)